MAHYKTRRLESVVSGARQLKTPKPHGFVTRSTKRAEVFVPFERSGDIWPPALVLVGCGTGGARVESSESFQPVRERVVGQWGWARWPDWSFAIHESNGRRV
ncbi:hypothetical protein VTH06DRAFT_3816 [Thermothelomyces fergusii]